MIWFSYLRHYGYAFKDQPQSPSKDTANLETETHCQPLQTELNTKVRTSLVGRSDSSTGSVGTNKKRLATATEILPAKRVKKDGGPGYDSFPSDEFLFNDLDINRDEITSTQREIEKTILTQVDEEETTLTQTGNEDMISDQAQTERKNVTSSRRKKWDRALYEDKSVTQVMEDLSSRAELDALEREMDCGQLYMFRQAYLLAGDHKPKFISKADVWSRNPRVFKVAMTLGLLYLALLYADQPVLPVDIARFASSLG